MVYRNTNRMQDTNSIESTPVRRKQAEDWVSKGKGGIKARNSVNCSTKG